MAGISWYVYLFSGIVLSAGTLISGSEKLMLFAFVGYFFIFIGLFKLGLAVLKRMKKGIKKDKSRNKERKNFEKNVDLDVKGRSKREVSENAKGGVEKRVGKNEKVEMYDNLHNFVEKKEEGDYMIKVCKKCGMKHADYEVFCENCLEAL